MAGRPRAGVIVVDRGRIVLIERHRDGKRYFVCPGGGLEQDETFEHAAIREAREELGVEVELGQRALEIEFGGRQVYFDARIVRGSLREADFDQDKRLGTYRPRWVPLTELETLDVRPPELIGWVTPRTT